MLDLIRPSSLPPPLRGAEDAEAAALAHKRADAIRAANEGRASSIELQLPPFSGELGDLTRLQLSQLGAKESRDARKCVGVVDAACSSLRRTPVL